METTTTCPFCGAHYSSMFRDYRCGTRRLWGGWIRGIACVKDGHSTRFNSLEPDTIVPRSELIKFSQAMEDKLRKNDHKKSWKDCSEKHLMSRLNDEVEEYFEAHTLGRLIEDRQAELVDIANFCMMIWDNLENDRYINYHEVEEYMAGSK